MDVLARAVLKGYPPPRKAGEQMKISILTQLSGSHGQVDGKAQVFLDPAVKQRDDGKDDDSYSYCCSAAASIEIN